jgi:hypothetical protein
MRGAQDRMSDISDPVDGGLPTEPVHRTLWPYGAAGFIGPLLSDLLQPRFPLHIAVAGSFFVVFLTANWMSEWRSGHLHRVVRNVLSATAGATVAGLFAYLMPWK